MARRQERGWALAERVAPELEPGDILFLDISNILYREVARATSSWTSHVGICFRDEDGGWLVAESTVPRSRIVPLERYLAKTAQERIAVRRLHGGLSDEQVRRLRVAAESRLGRPYHLGFDFDSRRLFCSKFVYEVFKEALDIEVGRMQDFRKLFTTHPDPRLWFWRIWYFGRIPWGRRTVTPESQYSDPRLETVLEIAVPD
jgi:cell wall-associated NlpC family hydrolase